MGDSDLSSRYSDLQSQKRADAYPCVYCEKPCRKTESTTRIICDGCNFNFCYICKESYHYDHSCSIETLLDQVQREYGEDCKLCPACLIPIEKNEGCNAMKCTFCKTRFCWQCLKTNDNLENHSCENYVED